MQDIHLSWDSPSPLHGRSVSPLEDTPREWLSVRVVGTAERVVTTVFFGPVASDEVITFGRYSRKDVVLCLGHSGGHYQRTSVRSET